MDQAKGPIPATRRVAVVSSPGRIFDADLYDHPRVRPLRELFQR